MGKTIEFIYCLTGTNVQPARVDLRDTVTSLQGVSANNSIEFFL